MQCTYMAKDNSTGISRWAIEEGAERGRSRERGFIAQKLFSYRCPEMR